MLINLEKGLLSIYCINWMQLDQLDNPYDEISFCVIQEAVQ